MRITLVNHRYRPFRGGSELSVQQYAEGWARMGHDVTVVTSNAFDLEYFWDPKRRQVNAPARERMNGVEIIRVPIRHIPASSFVFRAGRRGMGEASRIMRWAPPYAFVSRRQPWMPGLATAIVENGKPDVILAANLGLEGLALTAQRVAHEVGAAFVMVPKAHLGHAGDRISRRYVSMPQHVALLRRSDAVVTMTEHEAGFVRALGVEAERVFVAGAGVDASQVTGGDAARSRGKFGLNHPIVLALGAVAPDKGSMDLARAAQELEGRGIAADIVFAGPVLSAFSTWFERVPADQRQAIHVLGPVSDDDKRDLLAACAMLALPSRSESFGIVYLEAWANGKPVIAADVAAVQEIVEPDVTGLITPFADHIVLADTIQQLLEDAALAARLGEAGRELALGRFSWENVVAQVDAAATYALAHRKHGKGRA